MTSFVSPFTGDVILPTDVSYADYTLDGDVQLQWPTDATGTENPAARIMDITGDTGVLIMPTANQVSVGQDALIRNVSGIDFDVNNFDGSVIVTVEAGKASYLYLTSNATTAGSWGIIDFGAGTSSADASLLAGLGLVAISTTLNQSHPTSSMSNGYTLLDTDRAQTKIWTSGSGTVTLPLSNTLGNNWFFIFKNNGSGTLTMDCSGAETIDGLVDKPFNPDESAFIICTGTEYISVGYGQSNTFFFTNLVKPVTGGTYYLTSNESGSTIQEYVGALVSNVTAVYLPIVNLYIISNKTTDNGFTLSVTTGFGNTAAIPPGQTASLVCDGTDFFNSNTVQAGATSLNLIDGTVGTPAINFANETSTGIWRSGAGEIDIAVLGVNRLALTATGLTIDGDGTFVNGISGGVFT